MVKSGGTGYVDDETFVKNNDSCLTSGAKFAFKGGLVGATVSAFQAQHQVGILGFPQMVGQGMVKYVLPGALAGAVFASTTCILDNVRSKDTPITNAFFGGLAAGFVAGSKSHNPWIGMRLGLFFGTVGAVLRCFAVGGIMRQDEKAELEFLNKTLYISEIKHLAPKEN